MTRWAYKVPLRFRSLFRKGRVEQELADELGFHLEKLIQENLIDGRTREEARLAALRQLGGLDQIKEECRDARRVNYIDSFLQDLRYGLRMYGKNPGFTILAIGGVLITTYMIQVSLGDARYRCQAGPRLVELLRRRCVAFLDLKRLPDQFRAHAAYAIKVDRADRRALGCNVNGHQHHEYEQACKYLRWSLRWLWLVNCGSQLIISKNRYDNEPTAALGLEWAGTGSTIRYQAVDPHMQYRQYRRMSFTLGRPRLPEARSPC